MITDSLGGYKRFLRNIRAGAIVNKIVSGKIVYLENPLEEIVLRYASREYKRYGKYYVKHYGRNDYELNIYSASILLAVMEGKRIKKERYDSYNLVEDVIWNRKVNVP